jgi:hypothetical protein
MIEADNPYETSGDLLATTDASAPPAEVAPWLAITAFVGLPVLGGILGFAGYIAASLLLEVQPTQSEPVLSHGQQAILISLPISTLIGVGIGASLAFCFVCHRAVSALLLLIVASIGYSVTRSLWNSQIDDYGRDPSEAVLYHPLVAMCGLAVLIAFALIAFPLIRMRRSG